MALLDLSAYLIAFAVGLPLSVLAVECGLALLPARKPVFGERLPCVVLIPAHDEEQGLANTLKNVQRELAPNDRVVVVADNCSDQTAEIAREHAAETVVRQNKEKRGKGFALAAGVNYLKMEAADGAATPEVVVILDADCLFATGSLDRLVRSACGASGPRQAQYLMHASESSKVSTRLSAFAFLTKNLVRPRGLHRLGACVPLTGSGMAFPWKIIKDLELGTSEIVEDLELGLNLVMDGHGPAFCESARVDSCFPESEDAARLQRTRWEHGSLGQARGKLCRLLREGLKGNLQALAAFFDLIVPPLSLLVMASALAGLVLCGHFFVSGNSVPLVGLLATCVFASMGLAGIWVRFGRDTVSLAEIVWIPFYAGRKISMYLAVPLRPEQEWKRTERSGGSR